MRSLASIALLIFGLDGAEPAGTKPAEPPQTANGSYSDLPNDPMMRIAGYLDLPSQRALGRVNHRSQDIVDMHRSNEVSRIEQHYAQFFRDGLGRVPGAVDAENIFDFFPEHISGLIDDVAEFYQNIGRKHTSVLGRGSFQIVEEEGVVSRHYLVVKVKQHSKDRIPDEGPMIFVFKHDGSLAHVRYYDHEVMGCSILCPGCDGQRLLRGLHLLLGRTDQAGQTFEFRFGDTWESWVGFSSDATSVLRHGVTMSYRELIENTGITLCAILNKFPEDTDGLRFTPDGGDHPRVSIQDQPSVSRRGKFPMFWRPDQARVYGHYLMVKVDRSSKLVFFIFNQNGDLTAYKLYDGTTWRSSNRFGDYGAVRPDEWALSSLKLIQDLLWAKVVTFNFRSYVGHSGCTRRGNHQATVQQMMW